MSALITEKYQEKQEDRSLKELSDLTPILFGASAFQVLNAACELSLFEILQEKKQLTKQELQDLLGLVDRSLTTLLLGVLSLKLIISDQDFYYNSPVISNLFSENKWEIFKHIVAFEQYIVYPGQFDLTESLKTNSNIGLKHFPGSGKDLYYRLAENKHLQKIFYNYMNSWSRLSNPLLFKYVDFTQIESIVDAGGGAGENAIELFQHSPTTKITILEIPGTAKVARQLIESRGFSKNIKVQDGNMFEDDFPKGHHAILFSHQLGIWNEEENKYLLKKAYNALPVGGKVILFSSMANNRGDGPLMAALDNIYFATIPSRGGMIYSWHDYTSWLEYAGFKNIQKFCDNKSWTPHGVITGIK